MRESKVRVRAALRNCGYPFPPQRITINLAPADVKKEGSGYDLPMAVGIVAAQGAVKSSRLADYLLVGELSPGRRGQARARGAAHRLGREAGGAEGPDPAPAPTAPRPR